MRQTLVAATVLVNLWHPMVVQADNPDFFTPFGCTVVPLAPNIVNGVILAPAQLECLTKQERREVTTELQQRRSDGSFHSIPDSRAVTQTKQIVTGNAAAAEHLASGLPIECRMIDGLQEFRTAVEIRVKRESSPVIYSNVVELPQDCFGDAFDPILSEDETNLKLACQTSAISDESVVPRLENSATAAATAASDQPVAVDVLGEALEAGVLPEANLPAGSPASSDTVSAITALEQEFADCFNAGELRVLTYLLTGNIQREVLAVFADEGVFGNRFEHPYPIPTDEQITSSVRDFRVFPDGRAGAIVEWGKSGLPEHETIFHIYEQVNDAWRVSDEIKLE
jgi:hypothetical protein